MSFRCEELISTFERRKMMLMYRTNDKPIEDIIPPNFSERHPALWRIFHGALVWIMGACALSTLWLLFPGLYKLGTWFGNDVMGWGLKDIVDGPQRWFVGLGVASAPFLPLIVGKSILGKRRLF